MQHPLRSLFFCIAAYAIVSGRLALRAEDFRLRLVTANLTSGNLQSYDPGHGARILQGLAPDVVFIQEFNYGDRTNAAAATFVAQTFGVGFSFFRESTAGDSSGGPIPNGIISRFPILSSGEWQDPAAPNRDFAWARIDVPGVRDLWAVSVHLLTSSENVRNAEAASMVSAIQGMVPPGDLLAVGGDFNAQTRDEAFFSTLEAVVKTAGPFPADQAGNENTNSARARPYDGVYVDGDLGALATGVVIGNATYPNGLVFDSRTFTPLSSVTPVQPADSAAEQMQHMAVVRDFLVPVPEPNAAWLLIISAVGCVGSVRRRGRS